MFKELMASVAAGMLGGASAPWLPQVCTLWRTYRILARWMAPIFRAVDPQYSADNMRLSARAWLPNQASWPFLATVAVRAFRSHCFQLVKGVFMEELLQEAQRNRSGQLVDQLMMRESVKMVCAMAAVEASGSDQEYAVYFEEPYAAAAMRFYGAQRESWLAEGVSAYLVRTEDALAAEDSRCRAYGLPAATVLRVVNGCRMLLLGSSALDIVQAMPAFLRAYYMGPSSEAGGAQDLVRMYALFKGGGYEGGIEAMASVLGRFFKDLGQAAVEARKGSKGGNEGTCTCGARAGCGMCASIVSVRSRVSADVLWTFKDGHGAHEAAGAGRVLQRRSYGQSVHGARNLFILLPVWARCLRPVTSERHGDRIRHVRRQPAGFCRAYGRFVAKKKPHGYVRLRVFICLYFFCLYLQRGFVWDGHAGEEDILENVDVALGLVRYVPVRRRCLHGKAWSCKF